ncbi:MAG: hypothetical protein WBC01_11035 [Solirubrobacterales bacterium]
MRSIKGTKPSPALLVAVVALVAALAGTAIGGVAVTSLNKKDKKQVTKIARKQAKKQVNGKLPLGTEDIADGAVTSGKLADGAVNVVMRQGATVLIAKESFGSATASCKPGERATGGGVYNESSVFSMSVTSSYPTPNPTTPPATGNGKAPTGWRVWVANRTPSLDPQPVSAYVICVS